MTRSLLVVGAAASAIALMAVFALVPPTPAPSSALSDELTSLTSDAQTLDVPEGAAAGDTLRDGYSATDGLQTLSQGSTNRDWATLVLFMAGFPTSESNITVMLRWMRQENGPDDWWNRNNPLNNGWGSGGNSGLGSYDNLVLAAENAAEALHSVPGYAGIVEGFAASAPTEQIEAAIWASPWAASHYANGSHWSYTPVPIIASPADTW